MVELRALLRDELAACDRLLDALNAERVAIVLNQVEQLAEAVADKERQAEAIARLERRRMTLLEPFAVDQDIDVGAIRLVELGDQLPDRTDADLQQIAFELKAKLSLIARLNQENHRLVCDALDAVQIQLNVIERASSGLNTYDSDGRSRTNDRMRRALDQRL